MKERIKEWELLKAANPSTFILGLDEVGLGSLAGPLVVGACLAPSTWPAVQPKLGRSLAIRDSKKFRNESVRICALKKCSGYEDVKFYLVETSPEIIDRDGLRACHMRSFELLCDFIVGDRKDILIVIDGNNHELTRPHIALPKADVFVPVVSAASMVAKVYRDGLMNELAKKYPEYGFEEHKGYGTKEHQEALIAKGLCPVHRRSYRMRFLNSSSYSKINRTMPKRAL